MKRRWLTWLISASALAVFIVIGLGLFPLLVPKANLRTLAAEEIGAMLGAHATIGDLSFRILPRPHFRLQHVALTPSASSPLGTQGITIQTIDGTIAAWDLLRHRRLTSAVTIAGLNAEIKFDPNTPPLRPAQKTGSDMNIISLEVTSGKLTIWQPALQTTPTTPFVIERLQIRAPHVAPNHGQGIPVQVIGAIRGATTANASMAGFVVFNTMAHELHLSQWKARLGDANLLFDATLTTESKLGLREFHLTSPGLTRAQLEFLAPAFAAHIPSALRWSGAMGFDLGLTHAETGWGISLKQDFSAADLTWGTFLTKGMSYPFTMATTAMLDDTTLTLSDLAINAGQSTCHLHGTIGRGIDWPTELTLDAADFDLRGLKVYLPWLPVLEELKHPTLSLAIAAPLKPFETATPPTRTMTGKFGADEILVQGLTIDTPAIDFSLAGDVLTVDRLEGKLAGGKLSGTGKIFFGAKPEYTFDVVADLLDAARFTAVGGTLTGQASVVAKLTTTGETAEEMGTSLVNEGTVVVATGVIGGVSLAAGIFAQPLWEAIALLLTTPLADDVKTLLSGLSLEVRDLKANYKLTAAGLEVTSLTFAHPAYDAQLGFLLAADGTINGMGAVFLRRDAAQKLIADPLFLKAISDREGRLAIPFQIKGTSTTPTIAADVPKWLPLLQAAKEKAAAKPPLAPAPKLKPPAKPKAAAPSVKKPVITAPKNQAADEEQMMKVQVGK